MCRACNQSIRSVSDLTPMVCNIPIMGYVQKGIWHIYAQIWVGIGNLSTILVARAAKGCCYVNKITRQCQLAPKRRLELDYDKIGTFIKDAHLSIPKERMSE